METARALKKHGYELIEAVGSGGFGSVLRARQPAVGREVAVKAVLAEFVDHPDFVARFEAEARTVARLEHPHIVPLYDYWHDDQGAFLVMRYLKGGSLRQLLEAQGGLALGQIADIMRPICEALQVSHEAGIVHRDLKPENILLDERGQVYLTDFGIAKDLAAQSHTQAGMLLGSAAYLAPEQASAEPITPQTDIYTLGVLLYELLTGRHPFPELDPVQVVQRHLTQALPALAEGRPDLPPGLETVVQRATAKLPAHRHAGALAFWEELAPLLGQPAADSAAPGVRLPGFLQESAAQVPAQSAGFVGRARQLAALDQKLSRALEGHGGILFLSGGAGQGKSALARAFAQRACEAHPDLLVLSGECNAQAGIGDPYLPFREALEMLAGELEAKWASGMLSTEAARRLWQSTPQVAQALQQVAPDLVDLMIPGSVLAARAAQAAPEGEPWLRELNAFLERRAALRAGSAPKQLDLFEQATRLLRAISEHRPLLVALDDFQWADDASISLLFHLGRRINDRRILVLCAHRPDEVALGRDGERHPLEQVINELKRLHGEVIIDLAEAGEAEGKDFIEAFLETEPNQLGTSFRQALFLHTGGHPLFTVELLRAMQARGDLRKDPDGRWVEAADLAWDQLPARVEAVIEERIARLEQELRELLAVASVEGQDFTAQVLARIQAVEERKLLRELTQELQKRHRLVRELGESRVGGQVLSRYQFAHHLFQRYLYNGLSGGERRLLHGQIAEVLEELFSSDPAHASIQLAYHYRRAEQPDRAIPHIQRAGDQARAGYANQEAQRYYSEWLELAPPDSPDRFEVLAARAEVYGLTGRAAEQRADIDAMLALAQQRKDQGHRCDALLALADHYLATEHVLARDPAEQALNLAREIQDPIREGIALRHLGWGEWVKCDYVRGREYLEQAAQRFESTDRYGEAATARHMLSLALGGLGEREAAMQAAQQAVEMSRMAGDRRQEATGLRRLAIAHVNRDQNVEALPIAEQALSLHRQVGDWGEEAHALNVLGIVHAWLGDLEQSEQLMRSSLQIGQELGATTAIQFASYNLWITHYWRRGEYQDSLEFTETVLDQAMAAEDEWLVSALHLHKGIMLHLFGDYAAAHSAFTTSRSLLERLAPNSPPHATLLGWISRGHALVQESDAARKAAAEAVRVAEASGDPTAMGMPLLISSFIGLLDNDLEQMRHGLDQAGEAAAQSRHAREDEILELAMVVSADLHLELGQPEEALQVTLQLLEQLDRQPSGLIPHEGLFAHSRALAALGRGEESADFLRQARDRILLVAEKTTDEAMRQRWLQDAWRVPEILAAASERGIA